MDNTTTTTTTTVLATDIITTTSTRRITYVVLQTCQVLSLFSYFFVGYHILSSPQKLRKTLSLHVVFILLMLNFIQLISDISLALQYLNTGVVRPSIDATCTIWLFVDSFTYTSSLLLMAWASFERHLLIFHSNLFNTKRCRILFHYLPILLICLYAFIYYIFVDFFYPCTNTFDFSLFFCGFACYMNLGTPTLYGVETMVHQVLPNFLIGLLSGGLLVRTIFSRRQLQQSIEWRKYRKMIIQLLSISTVYLLFSTPFIINPIAQLAGKPMPFAYDVYLNVFSYWSYGICICLPLVMASSLPNITEKIKQLLPFRPPTPIMPAAAIALRGRK